MDLIGGQIISLKWDIMGEIFFEKRDLTPKYVNPLSITNNLCLFWKYSISAHALCSEVK